MKIEHAIILLLTLWIIYLILPREGFTVNEITHALKKSAETGRYDEFVAALGTTAVSPQKYQQMIQSYLSGGWNESAARAILGV